MNTTKTDKLPVRHPEIAELTQVRVQVEEVMGRVYGHLLDGASLVSSTLEPWSNSWIVALGGKIVGVGMTRDDLVSDLWLRPQSHGKKPGSREFYS